MNTLARLLVVFCATAVLQFLCAPRYASASVIEKENIEMHNQQTISSEVIRPEHIALNVPDPVAAAKWYTENLGMKVMRQGGAPSFTSFVSDSNGHMMLELTHNADVPLLEPARFSTVSIHLAFMVPDIGVVKTKLLIAGATLADDVTKTPSGDQVLMLRDPWGLPIQFVQRAKPMLKPTGIRLEHLALNVSDSRATARWFVAHLGMKIVREGGAPTYGTFVADSSDQMMLELNQNSEFPAMDFGKISHLSIHFALMVADVPGTKERLLKAGATVAEDITKTPSGDQVLMMRDPSGFPIQFVNRVTPMLK